MQVHALWYIGMRIYTTRGSSVGGLDWPFIIPFIRRKAIAAAKQKTDRNQYYLYVSCRIVPASSYNVLRRAFAGAADRWYL